VERRCFFFFIVRVTMFEDKVQADMVQNVSAKQWKRKEIKNKNRITNKTSDSLVRRRNNGNTHGIFLKWISLHSVSENLPGPCNMALIVPEIKACSRFTMNILPSLEMSFTYSEFGPTQPTKSNSSPFCNTPLTRYYYLYHRTHHIH